jgi:sulfhydrogenase subunit gamma (sulfur reductase)
MDNYSISLTVQWARKETAEMRLISLSGEHFWQFIPGQVAILSKEGLGESYFAIASAPEDRGGMEFLVRNGEGVSAFLFAAKVGNTVSGKGPLGKGFPIDYYIGRDLFLSAVGSAIAPLRSVLRSVCHRRTDFGKVVLVYGVRRAEEFPLLDEMKEWRTNGIDVILTVSRPEVGTWKGKTGHVQSHFGEALGVLRKPVAMICGMEAMIQQSRDELVRLGIPPDEILTNFLIRYPLEKDSSALRWP